jgi:PAS domain-containing protein
METKRLPLKKSNISMEFASMELKNAYPQDQHGALIRIPNSFGPALVWLQFLKAKSRVWIKASVAFNPLRFPLIGVPYSRVKEEALARDLKNTSIPTTTRKSKRQALFYFFRHPILSFLSKNKKFKQETYRRINLLNKKEVVPDLLLSPANKPPYGASLQENGFFARQDKSFLYWEEAAELAKTGFWEFNVRTRKFSCTGNALKLVNNKLRGEEIDFDSLIANFNEADQKCLAEIWHKLIHQGQEFDYNARIRDSSGDKWIKIKGKAIEETSTIVKIIGFLQDITESKVLEQSLTSARESAELEMKAKSDFVSVVTHEIRTPLNSISAVHSIFYAKLTRTY